MEKIEHLWWPTPVWEVKTDFDQEFNQNLLEEIKTNRDSFGHDSFGQNDIWQGSENLKYLNILKTECLKIITECAMPFFPSSGSKSFYNSFRFSRGWLNYNRYGQGCKTHCHAPSLLAITYYIKTPPKCGNLVLIDPVGGVNFGWTIDENGNTGFKCKEIIPEEGKLVFFPGYLLHMVEENKSYEPRVSLTTNIY